MFTPPGVACSLKNAPRRAYTQRDQPWPFIKILLLCFIRTRIYSLPISPLFFFSFYCPPNFDIFHTTLSLSHFKNINRARSQRKKKKHYGHARNMWLQLVACTEESQVYFISSRKGAILRSYKARVLLCGEKLHASKLEVLSAQITCAALYTLSLFTLILRDSAVLSTLKNTRTVKWIIEGQEWSKLKGRKDGFGKARKAFFSWMW